MTRVRFILWTSLLALMALAGCRSAHTTSAILYIEEQNYDKAVDVLHEGLEFSPDEPDAYYWLGEAHSKLAEVAVQDNNYEESFKNYELAYQYYSKAKELDPQGFTEKSDLAMQHNYTLRSNDAKREYRARYYEQAEGYFRLAYAALPDSLSAIKNMARMKMQMAAENNEDPNLYNEALDFVDQVLANNPDAYALQADKALILVKLGRTTEARRIYDDLVKEHGDDPALLIDMANLAVDEGMYSRAADLFVNVVNIYENDQDPANDADIKEMLVRAGAWYADDDIQRYEEALAIFDRALQMELVPTQETQFEYLRTYHNYGDHLTKQAEAETDPLQKRTLEDKAKDQFTRGVQIGNALVESYPSYAFGYYYLFLCHKALGDDTAAEINFKKFSELQDLGE